MYLIRQLSVVAGVTLFRSRKDKDLVPRSGENAQAVVSTLRDVVDHIAGDVFRVWIDLNVTMPQLIILMLLREHGPMRVSALAKQVGVSPPTVTAIVNRLVRDGLVERRDDPGDRRVVLNLLSAKGEELMFGLGHRTDEDVLRVIGALSAEEQVELLRLLRRLATAFDDASQHSEV